MATYYFTGANSQSEYLTFTEWMLKIYDIYEVYTISSLSEWLKKIHKNNALSISQKNVLRLFVILKN